MHSLDRWHASLHYWAGWLCQISYTNDSGAGIAEGTAWVFNSLMIRENGRNLAATTVARTVAMNSETTLHDEIDMNGKS